MLLLPRLHQLLLLMMMMMMMMILLIVLLQQRLLHRILLLLLLLLLPFDVCPAAVLRMCPLLVLQQQLLQLLADPTDLLCPHQGLNQQHLHTHRSKRQAHQAEQSAVTITQCGSMLLSGASVIR
jgi:hypothetical protein